MIVALFQCTERSTARPSPSPSRLSQHLSLRWSSWTAYDLRRSRLIFIRAGSLRTDLGRTPCYAPATYPLGLGSHLHPCRFSSYRLRSYTLLRISYVPLRFRFSSPSEAGSLLTDLGRIPCYAPATYPFGLGSRLRSSRFTSFMTYVVYPITHRLRTPRSRFSSPSQQVHFFHDFTSYSLSSLALVPFWSLFRLVSPDPESMH
ncbi:hypothetical protein CBOM_07763 [Ceraceosorus bombacis]|uniref:Uncharacterized protein n=1 Tax=Ceraceosorus bombacis TaxID=401625 RepID=A0A0P1BMG0_9BASI|nr:hypothetical protein CBOM_07763 [Ceraceosorus bombacis]